MPSSTKDKASVAPLLFSTGIALLVLTIGIWMHPGFSGMQIVSRLLVPLLRLMLFITIGLVVGQVIEAAGWTKILAVLARPLFRFGHLGERCGAAFTAAFFSGVTANAMLLDFYKEGAISRRQLFLTNFINQLPAFFLHLPTTFFIVVPLTGAAGVLYFGVTFAAALLRTGILLIWGHFKLPPVPENAAGKEKTPPVSRRRSAADIWRRVRSRLPRRVGGIAVYVVPIYTAVFVANAMGAFRMLREALAGYVVTSFIPMESLSVIIFSFAAEFTSGFAAAGALLEAGVLTVKQTVVALLMGNVLAFPVRALRHQLPRYIGIFSPKMGTQLLLLGQGLRVASILLVGFFYYQVA